MLLTLLRPILASKQLIRNRITNSAFEYVLSKISELFERSLIQPGEMVGPLAVKALLCHSFDLRVPHMLYRAGVSRASVTEGYAKLRELLRVKQPKIPLTTITLHHGMTREHLVSSASRNIKEVTLRQLATRSEIWYDPNPETTVVKDDREIVAIWAEFEPDLFSGMSEFLLRIVLNREEMISSGMLCGKVARALEKKFPELAIAYSDDNSPELVLRIRFYLPSNTKSEYAFMKKLEKKLLDWRLRGIEGIKNTYIQQRQINTYPTNSGNLERTTQYVIQAYHSHLAGLLTAPNIDVLNVVSNNIIEVAEVLGIEAARRVLVEELRAVYDSAQFAEVEVRHIYLVADVMTHTGMLTPFTKLGLKKFVKSPFARSTFGDAARVLAKSSLWSETDSLESLSSNIFVGKAARVGSTTFDIINKE